MSKKGLDQEEIMNQAILIINEDGYEKLTLASLAKNLNIKTPSLYNHVKGLTDLRQLLAIKGINELKNVMIDATIGKSGDEALLEAGMAYVQFVRDNPGLYESTLPTKDMVNEKIQSAGSEIVLFLLRLLEPYKLSEENAIHTVRGLRSIVHGFATLELRQGFNMDFNNDDSLRLLLKTFINGISR